MISLIQKWLLAFKQIFLRRRPREFEKKYAEFEAKLERLEKAKLTILKYLVQQKMKSSAPSSTSNLEKEQWIVVELNNESPTDRISLLEPHKKPTYH